MGYAITILLSYILGSSSMAFYLSKLKAVDIRKNGSGNLGASNATVLFGWGAGVLVAIHDIGKAFLAVILARLVFPDLAYIGTVAGVCAVLGHIFPFYLNFRGGKGFASFWGMTLALNWKLALVIFVAGLLLTFLTDYIVTATTTTVIAVPVYLGFATNNLILVLILCIGSAVIIYKHRKNYVRIFRGTEIGLRSVARGEHKVK